jgi:hypothetical protein
MPFQMGLSGYEYVRWQARILSGQSSLSPSQLEWHSNDIKGQCHEIFDPQFFHKTIPPMYDVMFLYVFLFAIVSL